MSTKKVLFLVLVPLGIALDLWTKHAAFEAFEAQRGDQRFAAKEIEVVKGFFYLHEVRNPGMAWSLFQHVDRRVWIAIRGILSVVLIGVYWTRPRMSWWANVAFAFVVAGALGNLYDNVFAADGKVRDFVLLFFWGWPFPVFNLADSMITIGAPLLLLYFAERHPPDPEAALKRSPA